MSTTTTNASNATINDISCDPATAERVYESPYGDHCFTGGSSRHFDEVLYRNPHGYWFLVRPLAPDEAQEWAKHPDHDHFLAERRLFPDAD